MRPMGKVEISIPLVTWRDGRPRFSPGVALRALGYAGEDLRHPGSPPASGAKLKGGANKAGRWFTVEECIVWSADRRAEIAAKRAAIAAGDTTARKIANATRRRDGLRTVGTICEAFLSSPRCNGQAIVKGKRVRRALAAGTVRVYRGSARLIERFDDGAVWHAPALDLTGMALAGILEEVEEQHGLAQTRALRAFLSVAFAHGKGKTVFHNPVADLETTLPMLKEDVRPATPAEFLALVATCDALGFPDVGDVIASGPWTGQRPADRLALTERQLTSEGILFAPAKKERDDERLLVPLAAMLAARLEAARLRRASWSVQPLNLFCCEALRAPWQHDWYRKHFRLMRHALATGDVERGEDGRPTVVATTVFGGRDVKAILKAAGIAPMPAIATLKDKHWRDTTLSWLPLAGADKWEMAGFGGHNYGKDKILKHYVAIPPEFARRGMAKLEAWFALQLEALGRKTG